MRASSSSGSRSSSSSETEVFNLIQEALKLSAAAVHFDSCNPQNLVGACDYYDKCILTIDEVLNKLPHNSVEWKKLLEIRLQYDDRMELLRERENIKYSLSAAIGVPLNSPKSSPSNKFRRKKSSRLMFSEEAYLTNFDASNLTLDRPPDNIIEVPYWTLRNVKRTITDGGFLTTELFVPKKVWFQPDVKFNGLSAKTAAFQIIVGVLTEHVETLYKSFDATSLEIADTALSNVEEEFVSIQNQLSKSFNFIKENSYGGLAVRDDVKNESIDTSDIKSEQNVRDSEHATGSSLSSSSSLSMVSSFASTVTFSLVKNVKKYAEVGYQRLLVALPSRVTADDMIQFTKLITTLCDKCQILDDWFKFLIKIILESESSADKSIDQKTQLIINSLLQRLHGLSIFMRGIICEILMRDIEYLIERYLSKMRKTFSRMYWDDEK